MANLSNINNILRTGSLGVGINRDPLGAFEISSATKPGVKMFNTSTNGKTYEAYSDTNGNYIIYDQDADDNRFVINTSGNATFAGNVKLTDEKILGLRNASNDYALQYRDLDFRFIGSADGTTQRKFSFGYYTSDNPAGTWNGKTYINSYTGQIVIGNTSIPADHLLQISNSGQTYSRFALTNSTTGNGSGDGLKFQMENLNAIIKNQENGYLTFGTNGRETDLHIDSSGNVGIGTTSPTQSKLVISGGSTGTVGGGDAGITMINKFDNPDNSWSILPVITGVANTGFSIRDNTDSTDRLVIDGSGNVGIGTTSPQVPLQIGTHLTTAPADTGLCVSNRKSIRINDTDGNYAYGVYIKQNYSGSSYLILGTTHGAVDTDALFVKSGNVGIGVGAPVTKLEVESSTGNSSIKTGAIEMQSYAVNNAWIADNIYYDGAFRLRSAGYGSQVYFGSGGTITFNRYPTGNAGDAVTSVPSMVLASDGNVGIGTTSPLNKLQVNGDIGIGEINNTRSTNVRFAKNDVNVITFDISVAAINAWRPGSCWIQVSGAQNGLQEYWSAWYFIRLTHYYLSGVAGQGTTNPTCILDSGGDTGQVTVGVSGTNSSNPQIITITLTDNGGTTNSMVADINCTMQVGINSIT